MTDFNDDIILKHLQGKLSSEEQKAFDSWLALSPDNPLRLADYKRIWEITEGKVTEVDFQSEAEWAKLENNISQDAPAKIIPMKSFPLVYKVAAALLVLAIASYVLYPYILPSKTIIETAGLTKEVVLPDGSKVLMNRNSKLSYKGDFKNIRNISLTGEAFFDVKPNPEKPFVIQSGGAIVKVLGTSFNVKANPEEKQTDVFVVTGKVSFAEIDKSDGLLLTPGMSGSLNRTTHAIAIDSREQLNALAWKDKQLVFKKTPLHEVIKVLRSYFKADIQLKNDHLSDCRFTSTFTNPTLPEVMEALSLSLNLSVNHQSTYYMLDGEGCAAN